jgi:DNA-binding NarL/FixJ family response regulator
VTRLSAHDLEAVLELSYEARDFDDLDAYRSGILPGLRRLVPSDAAGYNEVDPDTGETLFRGDPPDVFFEGVEEVFAAVVHQHPLVARVAAGDRCTHTISEFLTEREFHRLALYQDMFRRLGAEDQIAFAFPGDLLIGIALNRSSRGFSARDRAVLELIRPHLAQAYLQVRERTLTRSLVEAFEAELEYAGGAILVLDSRHQVEHIGEVARELLDAYVTSRTIGDTTTLPGRLRSWLEGPADQPMALRGTRGVLSVRRLPARFPSGGWLLALNERRAHPPSVSSLQREFGLARRQAEVLRLACTGRETNAIARELTIRPATVRKHLEQIYVRMGVRSRAAAVARALGAPR